MISINCHDHYYVISAYSWISSYLLFLIALVLLTSFVILNSHKWILISISFIISIFGAIHEWSFLTYLHQIKNSTCLTITYPDSTKVFWIDFLYYQSFSLLVFFIGTIIFLLIRLFLQIK
ncbi:MAG: hypothetical protein H6600_09505 [Flavobacteriales bacterium]|nr:hypothetical protein [Flavobacteriales bacterium]MCB9198685.1 hypothetical protein [Flavobacteriales bacterium]